MYADYVLSGSDDAPSNENSPMKPIGVEIEIPSLEGVFQEIENNYEKSLDQEHTVHTKNPKK